MEEADTLPHYPAGGTFSSLSQHLFSPWRLPSPSAVQPQGTRAEARGTSDQPGKGMMGGPHQEEVMSIGETSSNSPAGLRNRDDAGAGGSVHAGGRTSGSKNKAKAHNLSPPGLLLALIYLVSLEL